VLFNSYYPSSVFVCLFVCLLSPLMCFPPVISCNLYLALYCVYLYLHCAESVIGLVAVDSACK
jgi:hypothetical protein